MKSRRQSDRRDGYAQLLISVELVACLSYCKVATYTKQNGRMVGVKRRRP